jgi:uncharacterized membrane protein
MQRSVFRLELLVLLATLGLAGGFAFAALSLQPQGEVVAWLRVGARMHPLLVHFPIALVAIALGFDFLFRKKEGECGDAAYWTLLLGAAGAVVASTAGWLHGAYEPHGSSTRELLDQHRWVGIAATVSAIVAAVAGFVYRTSARAGWLVPWRGGLVVAVLLVSIGGHLGGTLVYGEGFLFEPLENWKAKVANAGSATSTPPGPIAVSDVPQPPPENAPAIADAPLDFVAHIRPLLDLHCVECHHAKKKKGLLRFDIWNERIAGQKKGSKDPVIIPGKPEESAFILAMELPRDHEDFMPPVDEGEPVPAETIAIFRRWIAEGAAWPKEVGIPADDGGSDEPADDTGGGR